MFSTTSLAAATAAFSLFASSAANTNLAVYWGQGGGQLSLAHYCQQTSIDIIPIGFINQFPQQTGNTDPAVPAENFGNACYGTPLYDGTELYQSCPNVTEGIPVCQALGKKVLLSLGGASQTYQLTGKQAGEDFANYLWSAYGPYNATYANAGGLRPFDGGRFNADGTHIDIDGFDFDIEIQPEDDAEGYVALINRLREHFATNPSKEYIISGAPQCYMPEANMGDLITNAQFDILWIQFYNNPSCSARTFADGNPNYSGEVISTGFNFDASTTGSANWVDFIKTGKSSSATLYIGLSASITAASESDYLTPTEVKSLISAYYNAENFGGIMLWEATAAESNINDGLNYYDLVKSYLLECSPVVSSTTTSSSTTSSPTISSTSSPSTVSESSTSASPTSASTTSASSTSASAVPTPTTVSSVGECNFIGCYAEPLGARALTGATYIDYDLMTVELCAQNCAGFAYFGVEYKGECYCGGDFNAGTDGVAPQVVPTAECSLTCDGDAGEFCGGSAVLDVYQCGVASSSSSSSVASSTTSTLASSTTSAESTSTSQSSSTSLETSSSSSSSSSSVVSSTSSAESTITSQSSSIPSETSSSSSSLISSTTSAEVTISQSSSTLTETSTSSASSTSSAELTSTSQSSSASSETSSSTSSIVLNTTSAESTTISQSSSSSVEIPTSSASSTSSSEFTTSTQSASTSLETSSSSSAAISSSSDISESASATSATFLTSSDVPSSTTSSSVELTSSLTSSSFPSPPYANSSTTLPASSSAVGSGYTPGSPASSTASTTSPISLTSFTISTSSGPSVTSPISYTTSTVRETLTYTISSCAATITDCPGRIGSVTTETVDLYTTVCPVTETEGSSTGALSTSTPSATQISQTESSSTGALSTSAPITTPITESQSSSIPTTTSVPESTIQLTTSTVQTTKIYTITSCAPEVTNCPGKIGSVTTETIDLYTTVCPVTAIEGSTGALETSKPVQTPASESTTQYTTSTVYATSVYTITSCAPTVTNCPAKIGQVTTEVVIDYTTVCPVTAAEASSTTIPGQAPVESSAGPLTTHSVVHVTSTVSNTLTTYVTIQVQSLTASIQPVASSAITTAEIPSAASSSTQVIQKVSTMTVAPVPYIPVASSAPYPTTSVSKASEIKAVGTGTTAVAPSGTGSSLLTLSIAKTSTTSSSSSAITSSPVTFTGAGNKMSISIGGIVMTVFAGLVLMI